MKTVLILLFCSLFIFLGCVQQTNSKILVGDYCLNRSLYKDSLFVYNDNTYTHRFHANDKRLFECKGKWEFNYLVNEIKFKNFMFFSDAGHDGLSPGNWDSKVSISSDGKIHLIYSSEDDIYFEKK